jgi:hypothetical protein
MDRHVGTYISRQIGKWTYGQMVDRAADVVNFVHIPLKKVESFVTNIFETMQGTLVTEFVEQLNTVCAAAIRDGVIDVEVAMLRVWHISDSTADTVCKNNRIHLLVAERITSLSFSKR